MASIGFWNTLALSGFVCPERRGSNAFLEDTWGSCPKLDLFPPSVGPGCYDPHLGGSLSMSCAKGAVQGRSEKEMRKKP
eukprot:15987854-Heterocapsa_arctica.AAC.1